jgi:mevalonate kinase
MHIRLAAEPAERGLKIRTAVHGELHEATFPEAGAVDRGGGPLRFVPACAAALHARGLAPPPAALWVHASLPAGRGFSSSAAFTLATLDALARLAGAPLPAEALAELAFHVEHDLLGVPCGRMDPLACAAGAPVYLRWDPDGRAPLRRLRPGAELHLVLGAFPRPRSAELLLRALSEAWETGIGSNEGDAVRATLATFAAEAEAGAFALERGDARAVGAGMDRCQAAYEELSAVLPALRAPLLARACRALRGAGALGAKLSGAGGDGSVIALARDGGHADELVRLLREDGLQVWKLPVGPS